MKLVHKVVLAGFCLIQLSLADNDITSGFEFLRTDFSPRSAAMGSAMLTLHGDINSMYLNPAGLAYLQQRQFQFNYANYLLDINGGTAAYAHPLPGIGNLSVGIVYMDYGDFEETDENAVPTGTTFSASDFALTAGLADHLGKGFSYGVNAKYAFSKLHDYNASAFALDFGLLYAVPLQDDLFVAFTLNNVGSNFEYYEKTKESLPLSMQLGVSKKLAHLPLEIGAGLHDINIEADNLIDRIKRFSVGGEFTVSEMLRLRLGYNNELRTSLETTTDEKFGGISGGMSLYWNNFRFDYAYSNFTALGNIHRIGIRGILP